MWFTTRARQPQGHLGLSQQCGFWDYVRGIQEGGKLGAHDLSIKGVPDIDALCGTRTARFSARSRSKDQWVVGKEVDECDPYAEEGVHTSSDINFMLSSERRYSM